MLKKIIILAIIGISPFMALAESWVQINKTTSMPSNFYSFDYTYQWENESSDTPVPSCNTGCIISPFYEGGRLFATQSRSIILRSGECTTLTCIFKRWQQEMPVSGSGTTITNQSGARNGCWGFQAFPFRGTYPTGEGVQLPGSVCGIAPPPNVTCDITPDALEFNFSSINSDSLNGASKSLNFDISCTAGASSVRFFLSTIDKISLSRSNAYELYSSLELNGSPLKKEGVAITVSNYRTSLQLKSILHSTGSVPAGEYSGSAVLIINIT